MIALDDNGRVAQFQMNDKCAAGTGRFLEIMAGSLGYSLEEFSTAASTIDPGHPDQQHVCCLCRVGSCVLTESWLCRRRYCTGNPSGHCRSFKRYAGTHWHAGSLLCLPGESLTTVSWSICSLTSLAVRLLSRITRRWLAQSVRHYIKTNNLFSNKISSIVKLYRH